MAINTTEKQRRFYLFRHTGAGENLEFFMAFDYATYDCHWGAASDCFLFSTHDAAHDMGTFLMSINYTYVIGAVDVIVAGQVPLEIVK